MKGKTFVVMGVSGSGKSTIGERLSEAFKAKFIDGDDLHPRVNIEKMADNAPLTDNDRHPWLERIRDIAYSIEAKNETAVVVCSALKQEYRDRIREGNNNVSFIYLQGSYDLIYERMKARKGHFMRETLLQSQFNTLEEPTDLEGDIVSVDISGSIDDVISACVNAVQQHLNREVVA